MNTTNSRKKHIIWKIILGILILLLVIRLLLSHIVLSYANKTLTSLDGYTGNIENINISLLQGGYIINGFYLDKIDSGTSRQILFLSSDVIDISVEWGDLFRGKITGDLSFLNPVAMLSQETDPDDIQRDTTDFRKILKSFMPVEINRFKVENGIIHYTDSTSEPAVSIKLDSVYIRAENLSNETDTALLPSWVEAHGHLYGGTLNFNMKFDPLAKYPTFNLDAELQNTNLAHFNDFFMAYANLDVSKGTFGLYTEVAAKDGKFVGYVKPVITDLEVLGHEDEDKKFLNKLWEGIVDVVTDIFTNKEEEQLAAKIPIYGEYDDASVKVWYSVITILRNAFIQALYPSIDYQINRETVKVLGKDKNENIRERILEKSEGKDN